jgi:hypothetical protein
MSFDFGFFFYAEAIARMYSMTWWGDRRIINWKLLKEDCRGLTGICPGWTEENDENLAG